MKSFQISEFQKQSGYTALQQKNKHIIKLEQLNKH